MLNKTMLSGILLCCTGVLLCGCGATEENLTMEYGETHSFDNFVSDLSDPKIAVGEDGMIELDNNSIKAIAPGTSDVRIFDGEKLRGVFHVDISFVPITSIMISPSETTLRVNDDTTLSYSLFPSDASEYGLEWKSSDDSVVTVDADGVVFAISEGNAVVTLSSKDGIVGKCDIEVKKKKPNMAAVFYNIGLDKVYGIKLGDNNKSIYIDSNPADIKKKEVEEDYLLSIITLIKEFGFPDSVANRVTGTRALDGVLLEETEDVRFLWSYSPDNGLEALFELKDD